MNKTNNQTTAKIENTETEPTCANCINSIYHDRDKGLLYCMSREIQTDKDNTCVRYYPESDFTEMDCSSWCELPPISDEQFDSVDKPRHYTSGKYQCIDVMIDTFGTDTVKAFCKCNAFKYLWRSEKKNGVEDLKKAVWYLNKLIELSEE